MAILGTETTNQRIIAREAIECAKAIKYVMENNISPLLISKDLPVMAFRMEIDVEEVLLSRIGIPRNNFITVVGDAANRASQLESLAHSNGICIGENLATNLHSYLDQHLEEGADPAWAWKWEDLNTPYKYYHYLAEYLPPKEWIRFKFND
jgi:class 3 adenylate cyclase